jgi:deoxyribodipyrimidine photolyase-like uncharacterized protein
MKKKIDELKKKYQNEWLAIEVIKEDEYGRASEGELIAHNSDRRELHEELRQKGLKGAYITFAGPIVKPGYAVMFYEDSH